MTAVPHEGPVRGRMRPIPGIRTIRPRTVRPSALAGNAAATADLRLVLAGRRLRLGNRAFFFLVLGLLSAMLVALLLLNTAIAQNSFNVNELTFRNADYAVQAQLLTEQVAAAESPMGLERKAREIGMVPAGSPAFLRLSDGKLLGDPEAAEMPPQPAPPKAPKPKPADPPAASAGVAQGPGGEAPVGIVGADGSVTPAPGAAVPGAEGAIPAVGSAAQPVPPAFGVPDANGGEQPIGVMPGPAGSP